MASVTICSDCGAQKDKVWYYVQCFPIYFPWSDGTRCMTFIFWMLSFKPTFSLFSFTFIKRLFSSYSLSAIRVVSSAYLRLLIFLLAILIPACASSSLAFHVMYSAHGLPLWLSTCSVGDLGSSPGLGRSPRVGKRYPFQYSGLENSIDCIDTQTWLSDFHSAYRAFYVVLVVKNPPANAGDTRDAGSIPSVRKIPWKRAQQSTPVFLPGESHEQRSLAGYSP